MPSAAPRVTWEGSLRTVGTPSRLRRGAERPTDEWRKGLRAHDDRPRELDTDTDAPRELIHRHLLMNVRTDWSHTLRRGGAARPRTIATPRVPRQPRRAAPSPPPPPPYQAPTKALRPSPRPARSPSRRRPHSSPPRRRKSVMVDAASSPHQDTRDASASPFSRDHTARGPRHGTADAASDAADESLRRAARLVDTDGFARAYVVGRNGDWHRPSDARYRSLTAHEKLAVAATNCARAYYARERAECAEAAQFAAATRAVAALTDRATDVVSRDARCAELRRAVYGAHGIVLDSADAWVQQAQRIHGHQLNLHAALQAGMVNAPPPPPQSFLRALRPPLVVPY